MKPISIFLTATAASILVASAQGTFPPTSGPNVPIMKTLGQVEPRKPIAASTSSVTISASGSYYLTGNITVATDSGINIQASNVTLDLNGYTISSTASPSTGRGIFILSNVANTVICNGHIRGTTTYNNSAFANQGGFNRGILSFSGAKNIEVREVTIDGIDGDGINFDGNSGFETSSVIRCNLSTITGLGIRAGRVEDCGLSNIVNTAIFATTAKGCSVNGVSTLASQAGISADTVTDCYSVNVTGTGIFSNGNVTNSVGVSSTGFGITALTVAHSYGQTTSGNYAISSSGIVNHSRGQATTNGINSRIAIGCSASSAIVGADVKQFCSP